MKGVKGTVVEVVPELRAERLAVVARIKTAAGELMTAQMPDREVAAVLPLSVLAGGARRVPLSLLGTVAPILARMTEGREVRAWLFKDRWFFSFQPWRGVRFVAEDPPRAQHEPPAGERP